MASNFPHKCRNRDCLLLASFLPQTKSCFPAIEMASAKENGGKSSDCNCVRDKIVPPLQEDLHVLGITFATVKQQENACRKMLVDVMRDGIAIAAKIKASQDDNEKLELRQQLCDNSARKIYFEAVSYTHLTLPTIYSV